MGILEMLRSASKQLTRPSPGACRRDVFVMVIFQHPVWRVGFLSFIASLLGENVTAFPTTHFLPSLYGRLHCVHCPLFPFFSRRCLRQHLPSPLPCQKGHHLLFRNDQMRPSPKVRKIPTLPLEISPMQQ